ncbi:rod shape-determining protein MreC [Rubinisphaera margarita]|uniref:rod shape-determining protein MreC n=1 Tax=Rubinisphaera margarita TaxID=2909586 RepID=UPI001EE83D34|nr:rod shape-determining protein MreC [Rubinisphaera margarita]MCG6156648.1 hypothetical protein [Rubinisphaera margarita]
MNYRNQTRATLVLIGWMILGCAAAALPESSRVQLRMKLRDLSAPIVNRIPEIQWPSSIGRVLVSTSTEARSVEEGATFDASATEEISRLERKLIAMQAALQAGEHSLPAEASERLFRPRLVAARRLSGEMEQQWRSGKWLDAGENRQLQERDWILKSEDSLIDLGADHEVRPDDLVLAGRVIVGQIEQVGRWSSSFREVNDPEFRCPVAVMKLDGEVWRNVGIGSLHGTGAEYCDLKYVENTAPVAAGDYIVLHDRESSWDQPLVLGKIAAAKVKGNSPFWEIEVDPAARLETVRDVFVLSEQVSPARLATADSAGDAGSPQGKGGP